LDDLPDALRHETHKTIIKAVAAKIRKKFQTERSDAAEVRVVSYAAIARTVLYNRTSLAARLICQSKLAEKHIAVINCKVVLTDPIAFDSEMAMVKLRHFSAQRDSYEILQQAQPSAAVTRRLKSLNDQSRIWKAGARRMVLSAIRRRDGSTTSGPDEMLNQLRLDWAPKFCASIDKDKQKLAMQELRSHVPAVPQLWEKIGPLACADLRSCAAAAKPSRPGTDGIPYSAWDTVHGAITLQICAFALFNGIFSILNGTATWQLSCQRASRMRTTLGLW